MKFKCFLATVFIFCSLISSAEKGYKYESKRIFGTQETKYRIPSLLITNTGRVIIAADKRFNQTADWNNIDTVIRYSDNLGKNFSNEITVIDLAHSPSNAQQKSAFLIDPSMLNNDGEILMLVDMFPKSRGFFSVASAPAGTGYKKIDEKNYRILNKFGDDKTYLVGEDGRVHVEITGTEHSNLIAEVKSLRVELNPENQPFCEYGDIFENGERIGNIFRGKNNASEVYGRDCDGDYLINTTAYLWLTRSNDNGESWNTPVDLSPMLKKEYISFMGTGPGIGIKLKHGEHAGRLLFPVYYTHNKLASNGRRDDGSTQQSALIYSDDNGETWSLGESIMENRVVTVGGNPLTLYDTTPKLGGFQLTESQVVELNSGTLKLFMRGYHNSAAAYGGGVHIGTSYDGGVTWEDTTEEFPFDAPYSQVAALHYGDLGGEEFIVVSAPSNRGSRENGMLHLGKVLPNDEIEWIGRRVYNKGTTQYSSIGKLSDGDIAIAYEVPGTGGGTAIDYTRVTLDWIAPNYVFKEFLPYPREIVKLKFKENTAKELGNIYKTSKLDDLFDKKMSIKYDFTKFSDSLRHNLEFSTPLIDNFGVYGKFSLWNKDIYSGGGIFGRYENKYLKLSQTLGLEYIQPEDIKDSIRGYDIVTSHSLLASRLKTDIRLKSLSVNKLNVIPKFTFDQIYSIFTKGKAVNQEGIELDLDLDQLYSLQMSSGIDLSYEENGISLLTGVDFRNTVTISETEEQQTIGKKTELDLKLNLGYTFQNYATLSFDLRVLGDVKDFQESNQIKYGIELSKKW